MSRQSLSNVVGVAVDVGVSVGFGAGVGVGVVAGVVIGVVVGASPVENVDERMGVGVVGVSVRADLVVDVGAVGVAGAGVFTPSKAKLVK